MLTKIKQIGFNLAIRTFPSKMGYAIKPKGKGYFHAKSIIKCARENKMSVAEYLETNNIGGVGQRRDLVVSELAERGFMKKAEAIVEIGAGTGMYMEKTIDKCSPTKYEVYETNTGWCNYLQSEYKNKVPNLHVRNATGYSLKDTKDASVDIVIAHGVFVYLPVVTTFQYLLEASRVCKQGGLIVFDIFSDRIFNYNEIIRFKEINPHYDFPVVIKEATIEEFTKERGLCIIDRFDVPYHLTKSTYVILQKL